MGDYMTLLGAEDVARAGRNMQSAADQMQSAAEVIQESNRQFLHVQTLRSIAMRDKYVESNVPKSLRVQVHHRPESEGFFRYKTVCLLRDSVTNEVRASAMALCSLKDSPSRKIGRAIAVGRALKQYYEAQQF